MTRTRLVLSTTLAIAVLFAAVFLGNRLGWLVDKPLAADPPAHAEEPGVIRFAKGAAQLSALRIEPPEEAAIPLAEPLNGRVSYDENVTARVSAPITGRVVRLAAEPGDPVKPGQPLLTLDSPELASAVADLDKAIADDRRKNAAFNRAKTLFDGGVLPRKELEGAEADLAQAQAETARARLRLRNLTRGETLPAERGFPLRSPIGGIVVDRKVNPGTEVRPDLPDPLFVVTDPTRVWVLVDLPEHALARAEVGHEVAVEVDAYPKRQFRGTIQRIGEIVDPATRRIQLRCALPNPERRLKPEMYARVILLAEHGKLGLRVPNAALVSDGIAQFVFVERAPREFERRKVTLSVQDREYAFVADGIGGADRIVTAGALLLNAELKSGG